MFQGINSSSQVQKSYKNYKPWFTSSHTVYGWNRVNVIGYARSGASFNSGHNWVVDDVYVATGENAAARVEIGNKSIYTDCTNLSISTIDSWSSASIKATIRTGRFGSGVQAYLFVIDANNKPSSGYPITIGSGGPLPDIPEPPTGLKIIE
jgi:hypothetical protein